MFLFFGGIQHTKSDFKKEVSMVTHRTKHRVFPCSRTMGTTFCSSFQTCFVYLSTWTAKQLYGSIDDRQTERG